MKDVKILSKEVTKMGAFKILSMILIFAILLVIPKIGHNAPEKVLNVRFGGDISGLDPASLFMIENQVLCLNIYNALVKYNEKTNEIVSDIAERWTVSPDGKVFTFYLRKGVKWHKGFGELTAEDVKYSYERIMNPETKSRYIGEFKPVDKIEVLDPYTVKIYLKQPIAGFLHKVTAFAQGYIVNRKAIEQFGDKYLFNPIGTGPFIFENWIQGSQGTLIANKDYFEGPPSVDKVVFKVIPEEMTAEVALQKGEIDIFWALQSPEVIGRLKKDKNIVVQDRAANSCLNLVLNSNYKPLSDKRVRQAFAYGINRKSLIDDFFEGTKSEATGILTKNFLEYTSDVKKYPFNPDQAKKLLKEAGYGNGFTFEISTVARYPYDKFVIPIADDLKKIGIDAKIRVVDSGSYNQVRSKGDVHSIITGITGPPDPDQPLWRLFHSSSFPPGLNTAHYNKIDKLLEDTQAELDKNKRLRLYHQIQRVLNEDVPVINLYADTLFLAHRKNVKNLTLNAFFTLNVYPVKLE